jgi:hypothetical protein
MLNNNHVWQRQCSNEYCRQWLANRTTINRQEFVREHVSDRRRAKFREQYVHDWHDMKLDSKSMLNTFDGLLCRINVTWTFRLINTRQYPNLARTIGTNQSRAMLVLQAQVSQNGHRYDHESNYSYQSFVTLCIYYRIE